MQPLAAAPRLPPRAGRVLPERTDQLERLAPVLGTEQRGRLRTRVDHVRRLRSRRVQLPDPLQRRPGGLGELHRGLRRLDPCLAQIVGVEDGRPPVRAVPADQDSRGVPAGVHGDRVDRLRVEVRARDLPRPAVSAADEETLAGACGEQNVGHGPGPPETPLCRNSASLHPATDSGPRTRPPPRPRRRAAARTPSGGCRALDRRPAAALAFSCRGKRLRCGRAVRLRVAVRPVPPRPRSPRGDLRRTARRRRRLAPERLRLARRRRAARGAPRICI